MGSFAGICEIVEEKEEPNGRTYPPNLGMDKDMHHPVLKMGYKGSIEDDIDKLFQSISVKTTSKSMSPSNHTSASTSRSTSPLRRNALMKRPMIVGTPRSPKVGTSEPVSLKQALRDLCISKASEVAAQKRLSKSVASPRISEAERIKTLYNHVLVESPKRSGLRLDKGKVSVVELSVAAEDSKPISSENVLQQFHVLEAESTSQIAWKSLSNVPATQISDEIMPQQNGNGSASLRKVENQVLEISNTPSASHSSREEVIELHEKVTSSNTPVIKPATPKSRQKGRLHDAPSTSVNSKRVGKLTRNVPRPKLVVRNKISLKRKIKLATTPASHSVNKFNEVDQRFEPTTQLFCHRCQCALKNGSNETNHSLYASPNTNAGSGNVSSGVKNAYKANQADTLASLSDNNNAEIDSGGKNCDLQSANKEANHCIEALNSTIRKQNASTTNCERNGAIIQKEAENPTSGEKGEFSLSSKDSIEDYSSTTSMSEESNLSRFSCGYKPHMSKDVRWEAVKHVKMQHGVLGLRHFNLLKKLGCGDIGTVYLAELIGTNCLFAIKVMDSEFLARRKKMPRAQAERDILKMLDHPFLPTLYTQFTSDNLSCLVMEYCPGGDLHVLRQKQLGRCFSEPAARFYVAEVLLALEYLHMLGVIYRDLKPENILVREDGHIMLTDFDLSLRCSVNPTLLRSSSPPSQDPARISGPQNSSSCIEPLCIEPSCRVSCFSPRISSSAAAAKAKTTRKLKKPDLLTDQFRSLPQLVAEPTDARSNSFVGTHEYLAPEIIKGQGHGAAVDWWTFGVLLYELLYGRTPFKGCNNDETLANVVLQSLRFPDSPLVSFQARDLIRGLLVKEPENRLGSEIGAAEIKRHPFFEGLNWALIRCAVPPELPDFYDYGVSEMVSPESKSRYLECKAIGEHLEFELF